MVSCCCVPQCSNREPGHRSPKEKVLQKRWLIAIRRDKFTPTVHSRICKQHFVPEDYVLPKESVKAKATPLLKKDAVPSRFAWSRDPPPSYVERKARAAQRQALRAERIIKKKQAQTVDMEIPSIEVNSPIESDDQHCEVETALLMEDIPAEVEVECATKDVGVQCCEKNLSVEPVMRNISVQTSPVIDSDLSVERLKTKPAELKFYTGFDDFEHFLLVFNLLGDQVNSLLYYPQMQPATHSRPLSPADEFLLTLMRLRCNKTFLELGFQFGVSKSAASNIFITWINFLYCQFKELNLWTPRNVLEQNLKLRGENYSATVIIDCTEIRIEKPKNPVAQQQTYSTYKGTNTVKVLVGISPNGCVIFVSDAYGGSVSDREIFERSRMIDLLKDNDIILCDRGFNIQDLVAHKNVSVNMPVFLQKNKAQFTPAELRKSKSVSTNRIHIERLIGLGKKYTILKGRLCTSQVPLASRIVFVCFMLANFRSNII